MGVLMLYSWQPTTTVQLSCIRYPPKDTAVVQSLENGSQVEVRTLPLILGIVSLTDVILCLQACLPHKEGEEPGWWIGKIAKNKGEVRFLVINRKAQCYKIF